MSHTDRVSGCVVVVGETCPTCGERLEDGECIWHGVPGDPGPGEAPPVRRRRPKQSTLYVRAFLLTVGILGLGGVLLLVVDEQPNSGPPGQVMWLDPSGNNPETEDPEQLKRAVERIESAGRIVVSSDPPGADVYSGIRRLGNTPVRMERPEKSERLDLRITKAGFSDSRLTVTKDSPLRMHVRLSRTTGAKTK